MKIGLILPGFSASEEDWCIPVQLDLVRHLARFAEVHVFPLRYPHHRHLHGIYGATVHPQGGADAHGTARAPLLLRAIAAVEREHRRSPFDLLHAMWADEPGFVGVVASRLTGVQAVVSLLGGELVSLPEIKYGSQLSRLNRALVRVALRGAARVTAGSAYLRRLAAPLVPDGRLIPLTMGVDTDLFRPGSRMNSLKGEFRLLHAASLVPVKDQLTLLNAFSQVASVKAGVHLHIVGQGPLSADLEGQAERMRLSGQVTFHGAVRREQMVELFRAADLCIMTSRHEGQELVTLEAAACGRATISTDVGLAPDLRPDAATVPVGDADALAREILAVIANPAHLTSMEEGVLKQVTEQYTLTHSVERLQELYAQIAR